ncbi:MAG: ABC transporter permease [Anaerolineae bacterium]|nr:ABC transporter permease [Anaerolineae bacterium]
MQAVGKMTWIELKLKMREPIGVFFTLVFPLLLLFLFGTIYGNEPTPFLGGHGSVDNSVPGYIAMIIGTIALTGLPVVLGEYREQGILRRLQVTPLSSTAVLGAQISTYIVLALFGTALVVLSGMMVYGLAVPSAPIAVLLAIILCCISFFSVGFLLAGVMPTANAAQAVGMALFFPMLFLSGAAMPQEVLPDALVNFSQLLPLTHVVNLLKGLWFGEGWDVTAVVVLILMFIIATILSAKTFRWE